MRGCFPDCCGGNGDTHRVDGAIRHGRSLAIFAWMPVSNILVVVVDGLRATALGAYGNTTFLTPVLDQFASESLLFDGCFAPSSELHAVYRALWQSCHPARSLFVDLGHSTRSLPNLLTKAGFRTTLITDEPQLLEVESAHDFDECTLFEFHKAEESAPQATEVSHTNIGRLFGAAAESIVSNGDGAKRSESPRLIWIHSRGMYGPWDAPRAFQESLLDDEASAITSTTSPQINIGVNDDPDLTFRYTMAYAAQVMVLDLEWQVLIDAIAATSEAGQAWRVVLMGGRGFPLGEDGLIGGTDSRLTSAQLHVPWLIRFPDGRGKLVRSNALVSHLDLLPTLLDARGASDGEAARADGNNLSQFSEGVSLADRELHFSANGAAVAIRTPNWCFRTNRSYPPIADASTMAEQADEVESGLFVRPDDRWEANDVSKLCPEVIEELESLIASTLRQFSEDASNRKCIGECG